MDLISYFPEYRIIEQLYVGSRTVVYRGVQKSDRIPIVIKLLRNPFPNFKELVQFRNQYTISKNLNFPGILQPLVLKSYGNSYALVMPDCGSISLANYFWGGQQAVRNKVSIEEFLKLSVQITEAIDYLSQNRVIHKDIKPSNILVNPQTKQIKLIDFSIASILPREVQEIQNPNNLEGTLAYISPEQTGRMNRGIDYRSDFYSLGVTFYEMLTGKLPFVADDPMEIIHCHLAKQPIPIHKLNSQIPIALSQIVSKLMEKNAENRYQTALGIKEDLKKCLTQLQETGQIESFSLGARDISDRFLIPDKLYGRETEISTLLEAFVRVASPKEIRVSVGATEMMLVAGFSGIGKTAVVNEIHKPIVRQRGYFIKGKYDQFQRNIPFSAFVQAFRDLTGQLLTESDTQIAEWKQKILAAVGENGQVIIEVIPEIERIIGQQPPAPELSGTAAQNRFNLLFQKFTQVFTSAEHPLVMFLDDLQWADLASLKLIELLMADTSHLLLIGAYRDNEVNPVHPLMLTLSEIKKTAAKINTINLTPLSEKQLNQLVADTLKCTENVAMPLSELVFQKTKGNPFFATQFLKALHQDKLIKFDFEVGGWECDIAQVKTQAVTDDVVEFMALQLEKLPLATQNILKLAACIGNQFDLGTLAIVSEHSEVETATDLWKALQEGLVLPISDVYKFYQGEEGERLAVVNENTSQPIAKYKFLHDRVQQAAYSLIPSDQKQATHLQIGQLLVQNLSEIEKEEKLFDLVGHLNLGQDLITQASERQALATLNLAAGRKARNSTAYPAARSFVQTGIDILTANCWQSQYELTLNLYVAAAEVAYLNADFDEMEQKAAQVLQSAQTILDKVKIYEIQIAALTAQSQMREAISVGQKALTQLGIELPSEPDAALTQKAVQTLAEQLQGKQIEELIHLPVMRDPQKIATMQLFGMLFTPIYQGNPALLPLFCSTMVSLSLQFGNAPASTVGYAIYGMVLSVFFKEVERGYRFGRLAISLVNQLDAPEFKSFTLLVFGVFLQHRREALRAVIPTLKECYMAAIESGNFLNAGYAIAAYFGHQLFAGVCLDDWETEIENYCVVVAKMKQDSPLSYMKQYQQTVHNLREICTEPDLLSGSAYDEKLMIPQHHQDHELTALYCVYTCKQILAYLFSNYTKALDYTVETNRYTEASLGLHPPFFHFYAGLTYLALFSTQSEIEQANTLTLVESHQTTLEQWAHYAPMNHLHKWYLVEAEKQRVLGNKAEAIDNYERAISGAKANSYTQDEALANELAAKFYLDWGRERIAQEHMIEAYYCYARWGAIAKVADLERRYPQLLASILQETPTPFSVNETFFPSGTVTYTSSSSSVSHSLDLAAILKASQSLSGEIELKKLLLSLLQIVIENAGADKCVLMLFRDDSLRDSKDERLLINGLITVGTEPVVLQHLPIEDSQDIPLKLIYKVKNERRNAVLLDAMADPTLAGDPYIIRQQPKSILCIPILHQGKLLGVLYLENNLVTGAFTSDRVELLNLLCAQAAISLENAHLYKQSQIKSQELEESLQYLQQTQKQVEETQKFLQLVIDSIPQLIFWKDTQSNYLGCNRLFAQVAGLNSCEDIVGKNDYDLPWKQEESDWYRECDRRIMASDMPELGIIEKQQQAQGKQTWAETNKIPLHNLDGEVIGILGTYADITNRKQLEQERSRLITILESTSDIVGIADNNGNILYLNHAGQQFLQISQEEMNQFHLSEVVTPRVWHILETEVLPTVFREGIWSGESVLLSRNGREIPISQVIVAHQDEHGEVEYISSIMHDISERKLAELDLQQKSLLLEQALHNLQNAQLKIIQSEKMSALGNLVAGIAHEMNNPLGFISASLQQAKPIVADVFEHLKLYQDSLPSPTDEIIEHAEEIDLEYSLEDLPKVIDSMVMACARLRNISNSLRTFSRADQDYKVPFDLHEGIDSTILILQHRIKANEKRPAIKVVTNYGDLPKVNCFPGQINQVFMNILANALDALEEVNHGRSFADIKAHPNQITITTSLDNNFVKIVITDNGQGISEELKDKIFDHLFTTKDVGKGTGLGLAIARQIVEETHCGKLSCNSVLNQGTEFIIAIPL